MTTERSWLDHFFGPPTLATPANVDVPQRSRIRFVGDGVSSVADNPAEQTTEVTIPNAATPDATNAANGKVRLAGDLGGTAEAPVVKQLTGVSGEVKVLAPRVRSQGAHADCDALSDEKSALTANNTPVVLHAIPLPDSSAARITCDVVALNSLNEAVFFRLARNFVNQGGAITDGVLDAATPETLGGAPTYTATLASNGTTEARITVTGGTGANVRWYVLALAVRIVEAPAP